MRILRSLVIPLFLLLSADFAISQTTIPASTRLEFKMEPLFRGFADKEDNLFPPGIKPVPAILRLEDADDLGLRSAVIIAEVQASAEDRRFHFGTLELRYKNKAGDRIKTPVVAQIEDTDGKEGIQGELHSFPLPLFENKPNCISSTSHPHYIPGKEPDPVYIDGVPYCALVSSEHASGAIVLKEPLLIQSRDNTKIHADLQPMD